MKIIIYTAYIIMIFYFMFNVLLMIGIQSGKRKLNNLFKNLPKKNPPFKVSVLLCTKNEIKNIQKCVESLLKQNYPKEYLEILMIDESEDGTEEYIERIAQMYDYVYKIEVNGNKSKGQNGKIRALNAGIEASKGEVFVLTDADCEHDPGWIEGLIEPLKERKVGCVSGIAVIDGKDFFTNLQRLEWTGFFFAVGLASIGYNQGRSAWGGSMAFRRDAFEKINGYKGLENYETEDIAISNRFYKHGYDVIQRHDKSCKVVTCKADNFFKQRVRWFKGVGQLTSRSIASMLVFLGIFILVIIQILSIFSMVFYFSYLTFTYFNIPVPDTSLFDFINKYETFFQLLTFAAIFFFVHDYFLAIYLLSSSNFLKGYPRSIISTIFWPFAFIFLKMSFAVTPYLSLKSEIEWK